MKLKTAIIASTFVLFSQTSCVPLAVIGGAGAIGYTASQDRTIGATIDDAAIESQINASYIAQKDKEFFVDIDVDAYEGRVLLTGDAPTKEASIKAYNLAWEAKGVKEVINEIKIVPKVKFSPRELASDTWISTQIESRLLFTKGISNQNFSIETIRGDVYIMGTAKDRAELEAVTDIASQVPGVNKVTSYARIKGQGNRPIGGVSNANRNSVPVTSEEVEGTAPGSVKASEARNKGAASSNFQSNDLVIEDSPNAQ
jgi:osmotically-inducible protein OsmY